MTATEVLEEVAGMPDQRLPDALLARAYGTNNLPQSSNMCHETTSVGLTKVIGSPVGTIVWDDLAETDAYFFFGQNPGTNHPRMMTTLSEAAVRAN